MRAGINYGLLAFLAGAILGALREWLLARQLGGLAAAWIEAALLAAAIWFAARAAIPGAAAPPRRLLGGAVALALVLALEGALALLLQATGAAEARRPRASAELLPGFLLLGWLLAAVLVAPRGAARAG